MEKRFFFKSSVAFCIIKIKDENKVYRTNVYHKFYKFGNRRWKMWYSQITLIPQRYLEGRGAHQRQLLGPIVAGKEDDTRDQWFNDT